MHPCDTLLAAADKALLDAAALFYLGDIDEELLREVAHEWLWMHPEVFEERDPADAERLQEFVNGKRPAWRPEADPPEKGGH